MKKVVIDTIEDIPKREFKKVLKVDFHAVFPQDLYKKLENSSNETGYNRNDIVCMALEAFLTKK